jgi:YVTN family beta-propeller protein
LAEIEFDPGHPVEVAGDSRTGYTYVTNRGYHIGVLKGTQQIAALQTNEQGTSALAVDEQRGWAYAVNERSDSVTIIQGTEVITTIETAGQEPQDVAIDPKSGWAYVVSGYAKLPPRGEKRKVEGNVTVINGTQEVGTIPLGRILATHVVADPINGYIYVGGVGGTVVVIKDMEEIVRYDVGSTVAAMDVNSDTGDVYVLNDAIDRNLTQFRDGQFITKMKIRSDDPNENSALRNLQVHPINGDVYVVDFVRHEVIVVRDMEIIGRTPVGLGALKMAINPVTENVYVANFRDDTVTVIHGTEVLTTVQVGWYPYGIGVNPVNGMVYVSNTNDDTITVLGVE